MTYSADDTSTHDGEVVELYQFQAGSTYYRYTNYPTTVTYNSNDYSPVPLTRDSLRIRAGEDPSELIIEMPSNLQIVQDGAFSVPNRIMEVTVYRMHTTSGAAIVAHEGPVAGFRISRGIASVRCPSFLAGAIETSIPRPRRQLTCNNVLYDDRCQVARGDHDLSLTVSSISSDGLSITVSSTLVQDAFVGGEMVRDSDSDRRTIIEHTGAVVRVNYPYNALANSDAVTLYKGCDHTYQTCRDKFDNVDNFRGSPHSTTDNVFEIINPRR